MNKKLNNKISSLSIILAIAAFFLAIYHIPGWGWFLFLSFLCFATTD